ncbi:hypothetical protein SARC_12695 [Sphaeroforma arctica JP610]|uniref:Uracil-DNA glycosylase-like domain-containing protein n=1 Tax=Sphaeroforma arctica JP610 TaxID=667725 RepID=A0A0L0FE68_9EUKA|nr:hypothetical protein SARC_12695 [Sphaeroforma arctica JP610]KNC74766.1 hypothetical protein SARC_12695 [Sphaeroforma arctica JP610]|eukprot:XP_014148668.1 hypothetical protein SARC_12695 [Sphaeroforma arctica JP610]
MDRCTQDDLEIPLHKGNETPLKRMHLDQFAYKRLTRSAMKRKRIPERVLGRPKIGTGTCAADVNLRGENPFSSIAKGTLDGMCPVVKRRKRPVRGSHAKKEPPVHGIEPSTKHRASALSPSPALSQTCPKRTEDKSQTQRPSGASAGAARSAVADTEVRPQAGIQAVALSNRTDPPSRDFAQYLGSMHPLRVVFVGHNPSDTSWRHSQPYAHKSNRFWRLVGESGLVPVNLAQPHHFAQLPEAVGVGFVDLYVTSGSDASCVKGDQGATLRCVRWCMY